ncbi:MAG TPA: hypothetical protein VH643_12860 [Gemmataceae bacterium]
MASAASEREPARPVPEYARVGLLLDKKRYFLGENILIHFFVKNVGRGSFSINLGGDYRFATRHLRFSVTATDAQGREVPDPDPSGFCMGGLSHSPEVKPGEKHIETLPLLRYCRFEKAGIYRLRVSHDFGWTPTKQRKLPVAHATITLVEPNTEQARRIAEEMYRLPKRRSGTSGEKGELYADFSALAHPVYLPILAPRAADGDEDALEALGTIPTPEATEALIRLLDHQDAKFALKAVQTLNLRLPDPQLEGKLGKRNVFEDTRETKRRWLCERSWRAKFAPAVRKAGRELLLTGVDTEALQCGAFILECLGEKEDLTALARALDWSAFRASKQPVEEGIYPRPRGACQELLRAARMMGLRGAVPPIPPRSSGEMILFAAAIGARPAFRPAGWEAIYARLLQAELPYVREVGLCNLSLPPPPALRKLLPALFADKNVDVQIAACEVAEKTKDPELREPILRVLASAREDWLFYSANNAAYSLGLRMERIRVLVSRLDEEGMTGPCLDRLVSVVLADLSGYSGLARNSLDVAARRACKAAWLRFLKEHDEELRAGKEFGLADPTLPRKELFPGFTFHPPRPSIRIALPNDAAAPDR